MSASERELSDKARWYLDRGVEAVWLVFPESFEVVVVDARGETRVGLGDTIAPIAGLPDLGPEVSRFFVQIRR